MRSTLKKVAALVAAFVTLFSTTAIKAEIRPFPKREATVFDLVVKAHKAGLLKKSYIDLEAFNPDDKATPKYCQRLFKRAAKANNLEVTRITKEESSFEWLKENTSRLLAGTSRPEWQEEQGLWQECLDNLELEVRYLYSGDEKPTKIQVLYWTLVTFFPDIPIGYDLSDEAIDQYGQL